MHEMRTIASRALFILELLYILLIVRN